MEPKASVWNKKVTSSTSWPLAPPKKSILLLAVVFLNIWTRHLARLKATPGGLGPPIETAVWDLKPATSLFLTTTLSAGKMKPNVRVATAWSAQLSRGLTVLGDTATFALLFGCHAAMFQWTRSASHSTLLRWETPSVLQLWAEFLRPTPRRLSVGKFGHYF